MLEILVKAWATTAAYDRAVSNRLSRSATIRYGRTLTSRQPSTPTGQAELPGPSRFMVRSCPITT